MYSHLRGVMIANKITIKWLAARLGMSERSLRSKLKGTYDFTWSEAKAIRKILNSKEKIEDLFKTDKELGV